MGPSGPSLSYPILFNRLLGGEVAPPRLCAAGGKVQRLAEGTPTPQPPPPARARGEGAGGEGCRW